MREIELKQATFAVIGVTGYRRSGKNSTVAILERFGFKQYAFAESLRTLALAIDPLIELRGTPDELRKQLSDFDPQGHEMAMRYSHLIAAIGYEKAKDIPDMRRYLQKLGTEGVRHVFGPNAWVDALARQVDERQDSLIAISDVRFASEAAWVHAMGGEVWRINRPGYGGDDPHPSERDVPNLPAELDITATNLAELEVAVLAAISQRWPHLKEVPRADAAHPSQP